MQKLGPFVQDSLESSHPISVPVNDPSEINSLFDAISYSKVILFLNTRKYTKNIKFS